MQINTYVLVDGIPQSCDDVTEWGSWMNEHRAECVVESDRLVSGSGHQATVSTVFCGFDPHDSPDQALLYETLILHNRGSIEMELPSGSAKRCSTELEARGAHALALENLAADGFYPYETEPLPEPAAVDVASPDTVTDSPGPDAQNGDDEEPDEGDKAGDEEANEDDVGAEGGENPPQA